MEAPDFLSDGSRGFPGFPVERSHSLGTGEVRRIIDRPGKGEGPRHGDQVSVAFTGWLANGRRFSGSTRARPLVFSIGSERVVSGLSLAVAAMREGEKARFLVPPDLAYGAAGKPPLIPGDSDLVFAVELVSFWPPVGPDTTVMKNELVAYAEWGSALVCMKEHAAYVLDSSVVGLLARILRSPIRIRDLLQAEQVTKDSADQVVQWLAGLVELQLIQVGPGEKNLRGRRTGI